MKKSDVICRAFKKMLGISATGICLTKVKMLLQLLKSRLNKWQKQVCDPHEDRSTKASK